MLNSILKFLLKVNYSLSVDVNDYKEAHYSNTCAKITSAEVFFISITLLSLVLPRMESGEQYILFFAFAFIFFLFTFFFLGEFFLRKIEDLKIRNEHTLLFEKGNISFYLWFGKITFVVLFIVFAVVLGRFIYGVDMGWTSVFSEMTQYY
jgi:hypothetical protein